MQPKYLQKSLLPEFISHKMVPDDNYVLAGEIVDHLNYQDTLFFYRYKKQWLVIVKVRTKIPVEDKRYVIDQFEVPLAFLPWFANALEEFIKPSFHGGLHPGAMTSADQDVGGEMLCIQRAMDAGNSQQGYIVANRSREHRFAKELGSYDVMRICFPENLLYQGGLLDLIKGLGEKYTRGEL